MDNPFASEPEKKEELAQPVASSAPVNGTVNPFETSPSVTPVPVTALPPATTAQTVAPVATPARGEVVVETVETEDADGNELLIENDGNVFWLFQKVIWSVVKMALVVGVIGLLAWIIWRPSNNPLKEIHNREVVGVEKKGESDSVKTSPDKNGGILDAVKNWFSKEDANNSGSADVMPDNPLDIEVPAVSIPVVTELSKNYAYQMALWADWMEDSRQVENAQVLSKALYWAKRSEGYFGLMVEELLPSPDPTDRARRIDGTIQTLRGMLDESRWISKTLNTELNKASAQSKASEANMLEYDRMLADSIEIMDGDRSEFLLAEKSRFYQDFVAQNSKINAYHFVLNRVVTTAPSLQELHDNLVANRQMMIDRVHVVGFPRDQFHLILTPAEWKGNQ